MSPDGTLQRFRFAPVDHPRGKEHSLALSGARSPFRRAGLPCAPKRHRSASFRSAFPARGPIALHSVLRHQSRSTSGFPAGGCRTRLCPRSDKRRRFQAGKCRNSARFAGLGFAGRLDAWRPAVRHRICPQSVNRVAPHSGPDVRIQGRPPCAPPVCLAAPAAAPTGEGLYRRSSQPLRKRGLTHRFASLLLLNSPASLSHRSLPS